MKSFSYKITRWRYYFGDVLFQALGLSRVSLLGWSDGGNTALIIAGRYPGLCRKLVVWGSNSYVSDKDVECTEGKGIECFEYY